MGKTNILVLDKTSWRRKAKANIFVLIRTSSEDEDERRLNQDEYLLGYMSKRIIWTSACVAMPTSSVSCSWWWLCYMSKHIIWTSSCVAKPTFSTSCSWWLFCYMSKSIIWTSACVAKPTSSASCSWWWLCYQYNNLKMLVCTNFVMWRCENHSWQCKYWLIMLIQS